jgi:CopG family nickel-responsive transcriptional regulator
MTVERVGISFEPELLVKFDKLLKKKGYTNRSEAIRDIVRKSIIESDIETGKGDVIGAIAIVYDHGTRNLTNRLLDLQHHFSGNVSSTTHIHIDEHMCFEVLIIKGHAKDVRKLADNIKAVRGVKHGELIITKSSF